MVDMVQTYGYGSFYKDEELGLEIIGLPYTPCSVSTKFFHYFYLLTLASYIHKAFYMSSISPIIYTVKKIYKFNATKSTKFIKLVH